jgi:NADH dehydrogenase
LAVGICQGLPSAQLRGKGIETEFKLRSRQTMQSLDGKLITIFGGGGFIGRYVAQALLSKGARLRIAQRSPARANIIKPLGNLGQVQLIAADVRNPDSVARAVKHADAVVNLAGSFDNMDAIQNTGAANVAAAAKAAQCGALVHISAIGGAVDSDAEYGRSKGAGEVAVRNAFPTATILRPSIIFGREDEFVNRFAALIRMLPIVPVIGSATRFQPVFVGDVAQAIATALVSPAQYAGKTFDLGGPEILSMRGLNERIAALIGRDRLFVDVPGFAAWGLATGLGWAPGAPINRDQLKMLAQDNVVDPAQDGLKAMQIAPTPIELVAADWLDIYRKHGRFGSAGAGK